MIFGDEPRFYKDLKPLFEGGGLFAHGEANETSSHVGPGAYYTTTLENSRTGWNQKKFTDRAPFTPEKERVDRSHHFIAGVLHGGVIARPGSPNNKMMPPGPGHYNVSRSMLSPAQQKSAQRPRSAGSRPTSAFGHSTKSLSGVTLNTSMSSGTIGTNGVGFGLNSPSKSLLKGGMVYSCIDHNTHLLGPGYYNIGESLVKRSFNVRVSTGNSGRSPAKSPRSLGGSAGNSPYGGSGGSPSTRGGSGRFSVGNSPKNVPGAGSFRNDQRNVSGNDLRNVPGNGSGNVPNGNDGPKSMRGGSVTSTSTTSSTPMRATKERQQQFIYETPQ